MNFGHTDKRSDLSIKPKAIIQLSGGLDSAYCLYDWLKNNPDDFIVVHHINMINHEGRGKFEQKAVYDILGWLDKNGLNKYIYLENTFDYGNIKYIIKDVEVCGFHIGLILRNKRWASVKDVILPIYEPEMANRQKRAAKLIQMVSMKSTLNLIYPIKNTSKQETISKMPKELYELCWYCRKPLNNKPCGTCHTCKSVINETDEI
jgi:hypothetical protein